MDKLSDNFIDLIDKLDERGGGWQAISLLLFIIVGQVASFVLIGILLSSFLVADFIISSALDLIRGLL